jgi:hypothetical protein
VEEHRGRGDLVECASLAEDRVGTGSAELLHAQVDAVLDLVLGRLGALGPAHVVDHNAIAVRTDPDGDGLPP